MKHLFLLAQLLFLVGATALLIEGQIIYSMFAAVFAILSSISRRLEEINEKL